MAIVFQRGTTVKQLAEFLEIMCSEKDGKQVTLYSDLELELTTEYDPKLLVQVPK